MKSALIIFVRNPVLGLVKTRIAKHLGAETALAVYTKLLRHTHSVTKELAIDRFVFYADFINQNDLWDGDYKKRLQSGSDLGERMKNAFSTLFAEGYTNIAIIGSDCYELTTELITLAFASLQNHDAIIGPSFDGGYYLLGMRTFVSAVFTNKNWSTETVYKDTVTDLASLDCKVFVLPTLHDVDTSEDCRRYESLL